MIKDSSKQSRRGKLEAFSEGRDEMNLAELPLSAVSDRFLDGAKTVVFIDEVWDEGKRGHVPRKLSISGSDLYGLPTAKDDDVLLACLQLSSIGDFHSPEVNFSRYELLKLLRWPDENKYYKRLATSLRRWKGVTIYSDRAFYDHARKSWVTRDFGIFDNLYVYEREAAEGWKAPAKSRFVWNEVLFQSFQAGYIKKLDWDLYLSLKDPVAKRLYRFLDKRFYRQGEVVMDLHELAFNKVRLSRNYNTAQAKRAFSREFGNLKPFGNCEMPEDVRFRKISRGKWEAVFVRKRRRQQKPVDPSIPAQALETELAKRGVGLATGAELVAAYPQERVESVIELFDWYNAQGKEKGPGFLVAGIKSAEGFVSPKGFETKAQRAKRKAAVDSRKRAEREIAKRREAKRRVRELGREQAFSGFWASLDVAQQEAFEKDALTNAESTKLQGYERSLETGGPVFEQYREVILRDHFLRIQKTASATQKEARPQVILHP